MRELWLARNTIIEMLTERGFTSSNTVLNYPSFISAFPNVQQNPSTLNFICTNTSSSGGGTSSIAIHFTNEDKLAKKSLEGVVSDYGAQGVNTVILVTPNKLNPACKALLRSIKLNFEHFLVEELQFNITKHVLVPKHKIIPKEEERDILAGLKCEKMNLPTILTTDPVSRFYGAKVGDVFEITRNSQTTGKAIYYRAVREPGLK